MVFQARQIPSKTRLQEGRSRQNRYIKVDENELLIVVVYVDDIMFGNNKDELVKGFAEEMKSKFETSMIGELTFYLGLQILQKTKAYSFHKKNT